LISPRLPLLLSCLALAACADPRAAFDDFAARQERLDAGADEGQTGPCTPPAPGAVAGTALMAIGTSISPDRPILFYGQIDTPERDGKTTVVFRYHPLDASDRRTEIGDELVLGPYDVEDDGSFVADTGEMTLPGEANGILPGVPITSHLILHGTICGVQSFYCGTVTGDATAPVKGPITGDFGLELLAGEIPAQPRYGCAADQLAVPLE
jgi:hypothetical protein